MIQKPYLFKRHIVSAAPLMSSKLRLCLTVIMLLPACVHAAALRVVTDDNYPPYLYRNPEGMIQGYEADIWKLWEQKTGVRVDLVATNWKDAQRRLLDGNADVIDMMFRTPERESLYDFSEPYVKQSVAIYVDASILGIHNVDDLKGFQIGVEAGDACIEKLHDSGVLDLRLYRNYSDMLESASRQQIKMFCLDEKPANYYLYKLNLYEKFNKAFMLYQASFHQAVKKGNTAELRLVEQGMREITPQEKEALRRKWFGETYPQFKHSRILVEIVVGLLLLLGVSMVWLKSLRSAVLSRTEELERERAQLRTLVENSPDLIWLKNETGVYLTCNHQAALMLGKTPQEIIGKTDADLMDQKLADQLRSDDLRAIQSGHPISLEESVPSTIDGEPRLLETVKLPIWGSAGNLIGVLGVARDITERRLNERELARQASMLKEMSAMAHVGGWEFDPVTGEGSWTEEVALIHEIEPSVTTSLSFGLSFYTGASRKTIERAIAAAISNGEPYDLELEMVTASGKHKWVRTICHPIVEEGKVIRVRGSIQDITLRRAMEDSMRMANLIYQTSTEAIMVTDEKNNIVDVNPAFTRLTGYERDEVQGKNPRVFSSGRHSSEYYREMWQTLLISGSWSGEIWDRKKDGTEQAKYLDIRMIKNPDGSIYRHVAHFYDITEILKKDELIWKQENFDLLTQLPNRRLFLDRLQQETKKHPHDHGALALMFIDLDHFKEVNDSHGRVKGDELLILAARRITNCLNEADTACRIGSDEFAVMITETEEISNTEWVAQNIIKELSAPFDLGDGNIAYVSASIGIALYPNDTENLDELMQIAEQAMYQAKNDGRGRFSYFTQSLQQEAHEKLLLTNDLRSAIARNELHVYYQPIIDLSSGQIVKAETLLRWKHPVKGMVSPAAFIPLAEQSGLIISIGQWAFQEAINSIMDWSTKFGQVISLSVNKSPVQFQSGEGFKWLEALRKSGLPPKSITVEITEGLLLQDTENTKIQLAELHENLVEISIDDFGTGYSALSYLKNFKIDYLKIDKSFIKNITQDEHDKALTEAIIVMAHKLGMSTIAEGVETKDQIEILKSFGCDYIQGFYFSAPVPKEEFDRLLERQLVELRKMTHTDHGLSGQP